jgi:hypothetical protein
MAVSKQNFTPPRLQMELSPERKPASPSLIWMATATNGLAGQFFIYTWLPAIGFKKAIN